MQSVSYTHSNYFFYFANPATIATGLGFIALSCVISLVVKKGLSQISQKYEQHKLTAPLSQALNFTLSVLIAKGVCYLVGISLTFPQILVITSIALLTIGMTSYFYLYSYSPSQLNAKVTYD